ncbi:MAG: SGNH/GDSL hydrolase family protein [Thermoleophilia bacterium]|nr:SGNH/GDSL hydrolase family protein [Thermoleophilia bacterium]
MKARALRLLNGLTGVLVALLVIEIVFHVAGVSFPVFYAPDRDRGVALVPGTEGWYRRDGAQYVRINSAGFRDREREKIKPQGTYRIAVLGDSGTEAMQVALDDTFEARTERALGGCGGLAGRRVEVLNFGVSSYGTAQELATLRTRVWEYDPDLVILAFFTENDVVDNYRKWDPISEPRPYFAFDGGRVALDESFRASLPGDSWQRNLYYQSIRYSVLMQVVHAARGALRTAGLQRPALPPGGTLDQYQVYRDLYREPTDPDWREAWRITEAGLGLMRDEVRARGRSFLLMTMTTELQMLPDPSLAEGLMRELGVNDVFYPERRLQAFAQRTGIPILALAPEMRPRALAEKVYLHGQGTVPGHGHWNALGHAMGADLLSTKICGELVRP